MGTLQQVQGFPRLDGPRVGTPTISDDLPANIWWVRGRRFSWPVVLSFGRFVQARLWVRACPGGLVDTGARRHPAFQSDFIDRRGQARRQTVCKKIRALHAAPLCVGPAGRNRLRGVDWAKDHGISTDVFLVLRGPRRRNWVCRSVFCKLAGAELFIRQSEFQGSMRPGTEANHIRYEPCVPGLCLGPAGNRLQGFLAKDRTSTGVFFLLLFPEKGKGPGGERRRRRPLTAYCVRHRQVPS